MQMTRNSWAATVATLFVVGVIILGFRFLGGPAAQRTRKRDDNTIQALTKITAAIGVGWQVSKTIPPNLDALPEALRKDPITGKPFTYRPESSTEYELCATFLTDNRGGSASYANFEWLHPKGESCFKLVAPALTPQLNP